MDASARRGLLACGNFIIDYVKMIDRWPQQDTLASIRSQSMSNGGGPYNVLRDLAAMKAPFPLEAAGLLGDDANGHWILRDCAAHGIDAARLRLTVEAATSYTDAMCVESDGRRTFFHQRGANALFDESHVDLASSNAKILLLAYLLLLDAMDRLDDAGRTGASRLLEQARKLGFLTAVDTVSAPHPMFGEVARASLVHADVFFTNEVEASLMLAEEFNANAASLESAANKIAALGSSGRVVVHSARGAVCRDPDGTLARQAALSLPAECIKGSTGAGDAFTAGFLHGLHEEASAAECLLRGVLTAAASLADPTPSLGVRPLSDCRELAARHGFQDF